MNEMNNQDLRDTLEELQDLAFHPSVKKSLSDKALAVAIRVMMDRMDLHWPEDNEPLTLDELREMDGDQVWAEPINDKQNIFKAGWAKLMGLCARVLWEECADQNNTKLGITTYPFTEYGKTWLAYRHKPERNEK